MFDVGFWCVTDLSLFQIMDHVITNAVKGEWNFVRQACVCVSLSEDVFCCLLFLLFLLFL